MHPSAMLAGSLFFDTYVAHLDSPLVVDFGAQDVNGSLRSIVPAHARYVGVDIAPGKGVDIVLVDPYAMPFETGSVDVVVSTSCFEHSEFFWVTFLEIMRVLSPHGVFYLNVPSNGAFHRYPVDCWRFYPDSGVALVRWAQRNQMNPLLLESFVSNQYRDQWNDFVCVILRDASFSGMYSQRILHKISNFTNGLCHPDLQQFIHPAELTEDQLRVEAQKGQISQVPIAED